MGGRVDVIGGKIGLIVPIIMIPADVEMNGSDPADNVIVSVTYGRLTTTEFPKVVVTPPPDPLK